MYEIYLITNQINEKRYVGQTVVGLKKRFARHISDAKAGEKFYLHRAIRKYGPDRFTVSLLATAKDQKDQKDLDRLETFWIKMLSTRSPNGYNSTDGGEGVPGLLQSKRARKTAGELGKKQRGENSPTFRHDLSTDYMVSLHKQGESIAHIARLLKVPDSTIRRRLKSAGVSLNPVPETHQNVLTTDMISMFKNGATYQKIAQALTCSTMCVYNRLKKVGVDRSRSHSLDSDKIVSLYRSGSTGQEIADYFSVSASCILRRLKKLGTPVRLPRPRIKHGKYAKNYAAVTGSPV